MVRQLNSWLIVGVLIALNAHAGRTLAQHLGDVEVEINARQLATNYTGYHAELDESGFLYDADEPGFEADDGVFLAGSQLGFDVIPTTILGVSRNLWYWNGLGGPVVDASWGPTPFMPQKHNFEFAKGLADVDINDNTGASVVSGFNFATADMLGGVHEHLDFAITGMTNSPGDIASPLSGVYLTRIALTTTEAGVADSAPFFLLFSRGMLEEQVSLAEAYLTSQFGAQFAPHAENSVPEPSTGLMVALGIAALGRFPRRRA